MDPLFPQSGFSSHMPVVVCESHLPECDSTFKDMCFSYKMPRQSQSLNSSRIQPGGKKTEKSRSLSIVLEKLALLGLMKDAVQVSGTTQT